MNHQLSSESTLFNPASRRIIAWLTLLVYIGYPLAATAQVVADSAASAQKRPVIDTTANGIPLVQIATPNASGLSHNQYTQYNVDPGGLILNNSAGNVLTQQAGYVPGNQNLANGSARIILNEVTGTSASLLNGYTEVAGSRAEVIIANPNGISCNGCGFINTSRGVLTTGTPVFGGSGSLDAFRVTGGEIAIGSSGLNAGNTSQFDLIARSVKVTGQLWANDLNVIAGTNQVNYANLGVQVINGDANKPTVGIDVSLLGGMYANKIRLIGTEAGVGVNSQVNIATRAGDIVIDNQGMVTLAGNTIAGGNLSVSGASVTATGNLGAGIDSSGVATQGGAVALTATGGNISNSGRIAGNTITSSSDSFTNTGTLIGDNISLRANTLNNQGVAAIIASTSQIDLWVNQSLNNLDGASIYSMGNINIAADGATDGNGNFTNPTQRILNESSLIEAAGNINIGAVTVDNQRPLISPATAVDSVNYKSLTTPIDYTLTSIWGGFSNTRMTYWTPPTLGYFFESDISNFNTTTKSFNVLGNEPYSDKPSVYYDSISSSATYGYQFTNIINNGDWGSSVETTVIPQADIQSINPMYENGWGSISGYLVALKNGTTLGFNTLDKQGNYYSVSYYPGYNPNVNTHPSQLLYSGIMNEISRSTTITTTHQYLDTPLPQEGHILASGNINFNVQGSVNNYVSTIAAGNNITISGSQTSSGAVSNPQVNNTAYSLEQTATTTGAAYLYGTYSCGTWYNPESCGVSGVLPLIPSATSTVLSTIPSMITAGSQIQANTSSFNNLLNGSAAGGASGTGSSAGISVPTNGLYSIQTQPGQSYVVVTDPRFASYRNFISSDYMMERLVLDPGQIQKRLGDGFYEQKLVAEQILHATGKRNLAGFSSTQASYQALMDAALAESHDLKLVPGVALTKDQIAALRRDIVWMVAEDVRLPDGTAIRVLAPKVYFSQADQIKLNANGALVAANEINIRTGGVFDNSGAVISDTATNLIVGDLINRGAIQSGGVLYLQAANDIRNESGVIGGDWVDLNAGHDIVNTTQTRTLKVGDANLGASTTLVSQTGTIAAANSLSMQAGHDLTLSGATIQSGGDAAIYAGNNFNVNTIMAETTGTSSIGLRYDAQQITHLTSAIQTGGSLSMTGMGGVNLTSAQVHSGSDLALLTGGNLAINAAKDSTRTENYVGWEDNYVASQRFDETVVGSNITAGNSGAEAGKAGITLAATRLDAEKSHESQRDNQGNITLSAANLSASGGVQLVADGNVNIQAVDETHRYATQSHSESSGFLSGSSSTDRTLISQTIARGSNLDGDSISVQAGHDLNVSGSDVVASNDLNFLAKNNLNLLASENTSSSSHYHHEEKSGFMSGGGLSISYGTQDLKETQTTHETTHTASNIGSIYGNVSMVAGRDYTQTGSNVLTPNGDIDIAAQNVLINEAQNTGSSTSETKFSQSGLTLSLSNPVVDAANTAQQMDKARTQTSSGRMKALAVASAALSVNNALDTLSDGKAGELQDKVGGVSVNLSLGSSSSESSSTQTWSQAQGSTVSAGGDIRIAATQTPSPLAGEGWGEGEHDDDAHDQTHDDQGNLTIQGSQVKSGNNTSLIADNQLNLLAAQNTARQHSTNSSSSGSIGVGYSTSSKGAGLSLTASASRGGGNADGTDITWTTSDIEAGNQLTLQSGKDAALKGATAKGKQVVANIGGNLNIESLQDTHNYNSKQDSAGFSLSIPIASNNAGASINASNSHIDSDYASVLQQSGIKAGDEGYQVNVKGNTDLKGAVIAASDAGLNRSSFNTGGTLTQSDINNHANYDAEATGFSAGVGAVPSASAGVGSDSGSAAATTKSGIGVSTKADTTGKVDQIFDAKRVSEEINAQVQVTQTFSQQVPKAVASYAEKQMKPYRDATDYKSLNERQQQGEMLSPAESLRLSQLQAQGITVDSAQATLDDPESRAAYDHWQEGGSYRTALHTLSGALGGGLNGAAGAATTASAAPLLDEMQAKMQEALVNQGMSAEGAKLVAQGLAEATSAGMGAAVGGTQGAAAGFTVDTNNRQLHPKEVQFLQDKDRVNRYKKYISESSGRALSDEDARRELDRAGAAMADEHWAGINGRNGAAEAFILQEATKSGQFYLDANGNQHPLFVTTQSEYKNETLNLRSLFDAYADQNVKTYLNDNLNKEKQVNWDQRYQVGRDQGNYDAGKDANPATDIGNILSGILNSPGYILDSVRSDEIGPLDSARMTAYYQMLLQVEGRAEEAGYVSAYDKATTQRHILLGLPLAEMGGVAIGKVGGLVKGANTAATDAVAMGSLSGSRTQIPPLSDVATTRSLMRENQSADILAGKGFNVEQNPVIDGVKNPDYRVNGDIYDNYAPETNNVRNIWSTVDGKVQAGQTSNVVINLADSNASIESLQTQFSRYPINGLQQVIVIDKPGNITIIKGK